MSETSFPTIKLDSDVIQKFIVELEKMSQAWKTKENQTSQSEVKDLITCSEATEIIANIVLLVHSLYTNGYSYNNIVEKLHNPINTILIRKGIVITQEIKKNIETMLRIVLESSEQKPYFQGGKSRKSKKSKSPVASDKRVTIDGKNRVVYVGSRGGTYIKKDGTFVRV